MIIFLDTGVLGKITSPSLSIANRQCEEWFYGLLARGVRIVTSDLCDYEIRRGLLVAAKRNREAGGLQNLNDLRLAIDFLPVTAECLEIAAHFWAESQVTGQPNAEIKNIDIDAIVAAQWSIIQQEYPGQYVVIATTNVMSNT